VLVIDKNIFQCTNITQFLRQLCNVVTGYVQSSQTFQVFYHDRNVLQFVSCEEDESTNFNIFLLMCVVYVFDFVCVCVCACVHSRVFTDNHTHISNNIKSWSEPLID